MFGRWERFAIMGWKIWFESQIFRRLLENLEGDIAGVLGTKYPQLWPPLSNCYALLPTYILYCHVSSIINKWTKWHTMLIVVVGSCCDSDTCQLKPATTVCRKPQDNDCDLPEFCTGESEWCPLDTYKYEGLYVGR